MSFRGPVFIGGTGRSGTTLVVRILDLHPDLHTLRWESQFLVAPDGLINLAERRWRQSHLERFVDKMRGRWYERVLNAGKPNEYRAGLVTDVSGDTLESALELLVREAPASGAPDAARDLVRRFTHRLFDPAATAGGGARWCEKTPRNVLFADKLLAVFPDMKFIHVIRDGRDVVSSMLGRGFWPIAAGHEFPSMHRYRGEVDTEKAASYWHDVLRLARTVAAGVPTDRYHEMRFEDLIAEPEAELRKLCLFLGVPFHPAVLQQDRSRHHIGRWRDELSPEQVRTVVERAGESLEREGYGIL